MLHRHEIIYLTLTGWETIPSNCTNITLITRDIGNTCTNSTIISTTVIHWTIHITKTFWRYFLKVIKKVQTFNNISHLDKLGIHTNQLYIHHIYHQRHWQCMYKLHHHQYNCYPLNHQHHIDILKISFKGNRNSSNIYLITYLTLTGWESIPPSCTNITFITRDIGNTCTNSTIISTTVIHWTIHIT